MVLAIPPSLHVIHKRFILSNSLKSKVRVIKKAVFTLETKTAVSVKTIIYILIFKKIIHRPNYFHLRNVVLGKQKILWLKKISMADFDFDNKDIYQRKISTSSEMASLNGLSRNKEVLRENSYKRPF